MSPARRRRAVSGLLCILVASARVLAGEMVVQGEVVDVVPLTDTMPAAATCHVSRPAPGAGLVALLEWDLRAVCAGAHRRAAVNGYRVYYRWDGRTYSQVMREPPGDTVSLRVQIQ